MRFDNYDQFVKAFNLENSDYNDLFEEIIKAHFQTFFDYSHTGNKFVDAKTKFLYQIYGLNNDNEKYCILQLTSIVPELKDIIDKVDLKLLSISKENKEDKDINTFLQPIIELFFIKDGILVHERCYSRKERAHGFSEDRKPVNNYEIITDLYDRDASQYLFSQKKNNNFTIACQSIDDYKLLPDDTIKFNLGTATRNYHSHYENVMRTIDELQPKPKTYTKQ